MISDFDKLLFLVREKISVWVCGSTTTQEKGESFCNQDIGSVSQVRGCGYRKVSQGIAFSIEYRFRYRCLILPVKICCIEREQPELSNKHRHIAMGRGIEAVEASEGQRK
jgi:hypothetical protein